MRNLLSAALAVTLLGAAGCVRFDPQSLSPAKTGELFDARSLSDPRLESFLETNGIAATHDGANRTWDLRSLTLVTFYFHPDLAVARAQWATAEAAEITAGERPNPSVTFTPGYDAQIPGAPSPWIFPVTFDWPIETAGKRRHRIEQARSESVAAYWKWAGAIWQARSRVRDALLAVNLAERTGRLLDQQQAAQSNVVRLLEGQMAAGAVSAYDVTQARVSLESARLSREDAEGQYAQAKAQLAAALGLPLAALQDVAFSDDELERMPMDLTKADVRSEALVNRTDVRGALADFAASQAALQTAIAGQYPDLHIGPGYAWNTGSAGDNEWQLGATVTLPILNQNRGAIAEAQSKRRLAALSFAATQAQAIGQIDGALAVYQAAAREAKDAAALQKNLESRLRSVQAMEKAGDADALTLANAQVEFATGAIARLNALAKAQQARAQLEDAVQSPLTLSPEEMRSAEAAQAQVLKAHER